MAGPRSSKRDIDRAKREKQAAKRERRQAGGPEDAPVDGQVPDASTEQELLQALSDLHARYEAKQLDFDAFEEARTELLGRLAGS